MTGATGGGGRPEVSRVAAFGYLAICLTLLAFSLLLTIDPDSYLHKMQEDGWVENLTLVAYLLAGALLFAAVWAEKRRLPRFILAAGGIAMAFIAGEELSWGQRILGFATPDYLFLSRDKPADLHNHLYWNWWALFLQFMTLPCVVAAAALFSGRTALFGVPLPSPPLLLALLAILLHSNLPAGAYLAEAHPEFWFSIWQGSEEFALLMILAAYALFSKRAALALAIGATLMLCLACAYVNRHSATFTYVKTEPELSELLLGLFWLCYAGQLLLATRRERLAPGRAAAASVSRARRMSLPLWPTVSWLVLAASAALLIFERFNFSAERAAIEHALQVARSTPAAARAEFDIHLIGRQLAYFKEPCDRGDSNARKFFLHIFPENEADLPEHRKQYGFNNLDFPFFRARGARIQGSCVALRPLPDYPIARIATGQHDGEKPHWIADFTLPE